MTLDQRFGSVLAAARTGAESAWAAIYADLAPSVLGYLRARSPADAEDLTSEVFVSVVRALPTFEGNEEAFRGWVFKIAYHRLVDSRRHSRRRPVELAPTEVIEHQGPVGDVEAEALEGLATARVHEALSQLSPGQRDVLLLRILGGLTVEQVAQAIGRRPGAVKALQRRGLAALKKQVTRQGVTL